MPIRVFLAGEGRNELGSRAAERPYQTDDEPGVIVALLKVVTTEGWIVSGARTWAPLAGSRSARRRRGTTSYAAPPRTNGRLAKAPARFDHEDTRNVLIAANDALDLDCEVLAFIRDTDGDLAREAGVEEGIRQVDVLQLGPLDVIGGVAHPKLEAWILAATGMTRTEYLSKQAAETELQDFGVGAKHTPAMVAVISKAKRDALPRDATRMRRWLDRAEEVLLTDTPNR